MKNLFTLTLASLAITLAHADDAPAPTPTIYEQHPHRLYFGLPEFVWLDMKTDINGVQVDSSRPFWGIMLGYEYLKPNAFYAGIDLLSTATPHNFHAEFEGLDLSLDNNLSGFGTFDIRLGYTIGHEKWMFTPFAGIGAHVLLDEKHHGLWERMPYYSAGLRTKYIVSEIFDAGLNLQTWRTRNFMHKEFNCFLGKAISTPAGWGGKIGLPLTWHFGPTRQWEFQVEPYVAKLLFSESQNAYGANLLFGYHF